MTSTNYRKTKLTLPSEVERTFEQLAVSGRNGYIAALRAAGWTLQSISAASGITRERVRQIVKDSVPAADGLIVPEPPELPVREARPVVEPDADKLAEARSLQDAAQSVRSNSDAHREEAERYTWLVADMHINDGVALYKLAKYLGVSHGALRFRLVRYGYMVPKNGGTSKVYTAIRSENRAV